MRILITGACGFVGSTLAHALAQAGAGHELHGLDNFIRPGSESNRNGLKALGVKLHHGDIRAASDLESLPPVDFVIDEDFDKRMLDAIKNRDTKTIFAEPESMFLSGTSETKNWITVAGILAETDLEMNLIDYVPACRSEAGTGCGMAFATWE